MSQVWSLGNDGSNIFKNRVNSASSFQVQNASSVSLFTVDTTNSRLYVGPVAGDTVGTLLVLGNKTNTGDPTGVKGGMYYNAATDDFRCYNGVWTSCTRNSRTSVRVTNEMFGAACDINVTSDNCSDFSFYNFGAASGSQTSDSTGGETGHPGINSLDTGNNAAGKAAYIFQTNAAATHILLGNGDYWQMDSNVRIPTLSTSGQRFLVVSGFDDSGVGNPTDGCMIGYTDKYVLGNNHFYARCASNGTATNCDMTGTPTAGAWYRMTVAVNAAGTASFLVAGNGSTYTCTISTNVPTGAGRQTSPVVSVTKSIGTTARTLDVDYIDLRGELGTAR